MNERINIVDVSALDGLRNEPRLVSTEDKLALIRKLAAAGFMDIQATGFVDPRWVPQLADAEALVKSLGEFSEIRFTAFVPDLRGYERAIASGIRSMEFLIAVSETFNRKKMNRTFAEALDLLSNLTQAAMRDGVTMRTAISTSFHCPFEGSVSTEDLLTTVRAARDVSPWRLAIRDTEGMAYPTQVRDVVSRITTELNLAPAELALHLHDAYGRGLANVLAGLDSGVREFDASTGGLGGCQYSPGASGNLATEDLVAFLHGMGFETGIDFEKLLEAAELASSLTPRDYQGHLLRMHRITDSNIGAFALKERVS